MELTDQSQFVVTIFERTDNSNDLVMLGSGLVIKFGNRPVLVTCVHVVNAANSPYFLFRGQYYSVNQDFWFPFKKGEANVDPEAVRLGESLPDNSNFTLVATDLEGFQEIELPLFTGIPKTLESHRHLKYVYYSPDCKELQSIDFVASLNSSIEHNPEKILNQATFLSIHYPFSNPFPSLCGGAVMLADTNNCIGLVCCKNEKGLPYPTYKPFPHG